MRFSIRDLLWATALVAMGLGWWVSYRAIDAKRIEAAGQARRHRATLVNAKESADKFLNGFPSGITFGSFLGVDWSILDEPLVDP